MSLLGRGHEVPEARVEMKVTGGVLSTKQVFGLESSLMVARRSAGYHSRPHVHDAEQLNYMVEGEMWIYVENEAFHLKAGDFLRVPRMAVHWGWNRSDSDCVLIESHTPGLNILPRDRSLNLLQDGEDESLVRRVRQIWASDDYLEAEKR